MKVSTKMKVTEDFIDELGHVNNSYYVQFLEKARENWYIHAANLSFADMANKGIGIVVLRLDILFKKEALQDDILTIYTSPNKLGTKSFVFKQEIFNQKKELITEATVTCVMFDTDKRNSIPVVEEIAKNFS